nr:hypothetical protein [Acinetobacter sp. YH12239]
MLNPQYFILICCLSLVSGCQTIHPISVNYHGVRMDVAQWINAQNFITMQQKRTLVQLSRAQQKLVHIDVIPEDHKLAVSKENAVALHCAQLYLSEQKIESLQNIVFSNVNQTAVLAQFEQEFPKIKLDSQLIQCQ